MSIQTTVDQTVAQFRDLYIDLSEKSWLAATTGTPEALTAVAEANVNFMRFSADPARYQQYKTWDESKIAGDDAQLARLIHLLHFEFAGSQRDPETIDDVAELERALSDAYTNFRAEVNGERLTANAIDQILANENDSERRREAWEASKQIGPVVADKIRRLAALRNDAAHRMGYPNFHRMSLTFNELDPDWLYGLLDELATKTEEPFRRAKAELDAHLSQRFGIPAGELMPWHYADPFFQYVPQVGDFDYRALLEGRDLVELALRTYDGLGLEIRPILERSDLYEREGKDQHAFCTHIDREGDVRILCNLQPTPRWMETLLHELGHAVYDDLIPRSLPWLLRSYPHILCTEAMAMLMGALPLDADWHQQILGAQAEDAAQIATLGEAHFRLEALIFARWVMVVVNFERLMYDDPTRDLDGLWWELVQKYQLLNKPAGREHQPDWATKYHIALVPAYYQNYLLGRMMSLQWDNWLKAHVGGIVGRPAAGAYFRERIFAPGSTLHWNEALEFATGERLNPDYFVRRFAL